MKGTPAYAVGSLTSKPTWLNTSWCSATSAFFLLENSLGRNAKMPIGILFWVLMIFWLLFGLYWNRGDLRGGNYGIVGGNLMLFILLGLLGWRVFGPVLQ